MTSTKPSPPAWRRSYNALERTVNGPLTNLVTSETFADGLALAARTRSGCLRLIERRARRTLHLLNLPAATDVRQLQDQIAAMNRQLAILCEQARRPPAQKKSSGRSPDGTVK